MENTIFSYDNIQKFNATEIKIYKFIVENEYKIPYITIGEFAEYKLLNKSGGKLPIDNLEVIAPMFKEETEIKG